MAELSTLLGFFESKRKRNHSPIKQITITRYIKKEELSTNLGFFEWPERQHYHKVTKSKDNLTFKLYFSKINQRQKPEF